MAKLLLVDDEPSILAVLSTLLRAEGYEVTTALGGEKARQMLVWRYPEDHFWLFTGHASIKKR